MPWVCKATLQHFEAFIRLIKDFHDDFGTLSCVSKFKDIKTACNQAYLNISFEKDHIKCLIAKNSKESFDTNIRQTYTTIITQLPIILSIILQDIQSDPKILLQSSKKYTNLVEELAKFQMSLLDEISTLEEELKANAEIITKAPKTKSGIIKSQSMEDVLLQIEKNIASLSDPVLSLKELNAIKIKYDNRLQFFGIRKFLSHSQPKIAELTDAKSNLERFNLAKSYMNDYPEREFAKQLCTMEVHAVKKPNNGI